MKLFFSCSRAAEGRRTAAIVGGSSAEVARWNRTEQADSSAHKLRGAHSLAPLHSGHYTAAANDRFAALVMKCLRISTIFLML